MRDEWNPNCSGLQCISPSSSYILLLLLLFWMVTWLEPATFTNLPTVLWAHPILDFVMDNIGQNIQNLVSLWMFFIDDICSDIIQVN